MGRVRTTEQRAREARRMREYRAGMSPAERETHLAHRRATRKHTVLTPEQKVRVKENGKRWRDQHADRSRMHGRVTQHNQRGLGKITADDWETILDMCGRRCAYCGVRDDLLIEHVIPLGDGGRNEAANVVPACGSCNHVKGNRGPLVMLNREYSQRDAWARRAA